MKTPSSAEAAHPIRAKLRGLSVPTSTTYSSPLAMTATQGPDALGAGSGEPAPHKAM